MTYGRWRRSVPFAERTIDAAVSHSAELVRGNCNVVKAPSSAPSGHLLPKGRRATRRSHKRSLKVEPPSPIDDYLFRFPGNMPMCLQMMDSMISSAPPPMEPRRVSR
jgi:hypothetical protein